MDMVERVARAIAGANGGDPDMEYDGGPVWWKHEIHARAVLAALREPTEAMIQAGGTIEAGAVDRNGAQDEIGSRNAGDVWRAMIDAAEGR